VELGITDCEDHETLRLAGFDPSNLAPTDVYFALIAVFDSIVAETASAPTEETITSLSAHCWMIGTSIKAVE
jgi:hypothetical protein